MIHRKLFHEITPLCFKGITISHTVCLANSVERLAVKRYSGLPLCFPPLKAVQRRAVGGPFHKRGQAFRGRDPTSGPWEHPAQPFGRLMDLGGTCIIPHAGTNLPPSFRPNLLFREWCRGESTFPEPLDRNSTLRLA